MEDPIENALKLMPPFIMAKIPIMKEEGKRSNETLIQCHLYGVIGDWYISEISENKEKAYGYIHINTEPAWEMESWITNCSRWGIINIKELQEYVNKKFLDEKDIRFLIARDLFWKPKEFSDINLKDNSLFYPGESDRHKEREKL